MSLINEALKRARIEAARRDAAEKGVPPAALPVYVPARRSSWLAPVAGFAAGLVAVALAAGVFWMVRRPPAVGAETVVVAAPAQEVDAPPAVSAVAAPPAPVERVARAERPSPPPERRSATTAQDADVHAERSQAASPAAASPQAEPSPAAPPSAEPSPAAPPPTVPPPSAAPQAVTPPTAVVAPPTAVVEPPPSVPSAEAPESRPAPLESRPPSAPPPAVDAGDRSYLRQASVGGVTVKVDFIVWSESRPFAQINGQLLSSGQSVDGHTLLKVERERVELEGGGERFWIRLK